MDAPASTHLTTSPTISSVVEGTWGVVALETYSPPVTAAVTMSLSKAYPFPRPRIPLASSGVATSMLSASAIVTILSTSWALLFASSPRLM